MVGRIGIFSTSKKPRKLEDKVAKDGKRSCLLTEERKQLKKISQQQAGKVLQVRFANKPNEKAFVYTKENLDLIVERKKHYEDMKLDKNWCIAQLRAALLPETLHLYQVELEKDNAFGLGFYLYGLGPDRLVPYVSIFVKDVIKGGYVDRQGMIKPHDQILKCGPASFVGIKQEEALRMMKNQPQLNLTMGRRTKADNSPVTKKDHKETLNSVGRGWLDPTRSASALENGDFRLIIQKKEPIDPFFTCNNSSPKKAIQIDTNNLARINSVSTMNKQTSIEAEEGTPNENQVLHDRQNHLEEQLQISEKRRKEADKKRKESDRKRKEAERKTQESERRYQEILGELKKLKHEKDFASQEARYANLKIGELAHKNTQLVLDSKGVPANAWDDQPELAAKEVAGDLESLLDHDDTVSVSTIRTMEPMVYCSPGRSGFREMEMLSSEALERSTELPQGGQYVNLQTPSLSDSTSTCRLSYPSSCSNYSSRRQSGQSGQLSIPDSHLSSIASLNSALSYNSITSDEYDPEQTPVNRILDPRLAKIDDGYGELSQHQMFGDHEEGDEEDDEDDEDEEEREFESEVDGSLRENKVFLV